MPRSAARRHAPRARHAARRARWRRVLTALGVTVAVLLATGSVSAFVVYQKLNGNITQENVDNLIGGDRPTKVEVPDAPQEPLNILLLGSDERSGKAAENPNVAGRRSDTTILLHLAADRQSAVMVSIPRDTMVPIPSCKRPDGTVVPAQTLAMFNSAFSEAGAACTISRNPNRVDVLIAEDGEVVAGLDAVTLRRWGTVDGQWAAALTAAGFPDDDEEPGEEICRWTPSQCAALALAAVTGITLDAGMLAGPWLGGLCTGPAG